MGEIVRLQKYIAMCGKASRRRAEELILNQQVTVDGQVVDKLGSKVEIGASKVALNGELLEIPKKKYYIMLNKPIGYVTTVSDQFNRPTVTDLIKDEINFPLHPVGRLDYDTEGLLLLTNDGDFTYHITHPKNKVNKTYIATIKNGLTISDLQKLRKGVKVENYKTSPAQVEIISTVPGKSDVKIGIHEGKNRQVRKMFESLGHTVIALKRTAIGSVILGNLPLGRWRHLTTHEINYLKGN